MGKISGPLLDRVDIHIELPPVRYKKLIRENSAEQSVTIKLTRKYCCPNNDAKDLLEKAMKELNLSARAYDKILKVNRTIADLAESEVIKIAHLSKAVQYRNLDR